MSGINTYKKTISYICIYYDSIGFYQGDQRAWKTT